ncbi:MAG: histidine triad nucleotide-binding protein [Clostridiaceae bacterium]|nr:histidine triad nucleotide-binding protein [Eubacteriales bacterium]
MENCLFCKIAAGEIPCNKAYEDDAVLAFHDIAPQAPVHVLIIPKKHVGDVTALVPDDAALWFHMAEVANKLAKELKVDEKGFRIVTNVGADGGQSVNHLHLHLLGGRSMKWPPG